ncbi:hypothetical protein TGVEG_235140 [Toxoplasma gondii VEG]|uniref:Uncharacterized protein n=1 Tax=Toxoplasma gondii (strain ATCC 50861 / VEG) TaxID=432359 RepID=V4ZAB4_TOXGV|nr:hypothetical protein TGVEG_235140 [Toxoplasma gondii VEG]
MSLFGRRTSTPQSGRQPPRAVRAAPQAASEATAPPDPESPPARPSRRALRERRHTPVEQTAAAQGASGGRRVPDTGRLASVSARQHSLGGAASVRSTRSNPASNVGRWSRGLAYARQTRLAYGPYRDNQDSLMNYPRREHPRPWMLAAARELASLLPPGERDRFIAGVNVDVPGTEEQRHGISFPQAEDVLQKKLPLKKRPSYRPVESPAVSRDPSTLHLPVMEFQPGGTPRGVVAPVTTSLDRQHGESDPSSSQKGASPPSAGVVSVGGMTSSRRSPSPVRSTLSYPSPSLDVPRTVSGDGASGQLMETNISPARKPSRRARPTVIVRPSTTVIDVPDIIQ